MTAHPDHHYIVALRAGDFTVLDEIYQDHVPTISAWVGKNSGEATDAQDVFQEAIIALVAKANDPDFVLTCPLGALLFRICQNQWMYQLRKNKREREVRNDQPRSSVGEGDVHMMLEAVEEESLHQEKLRVAFSQLSELCQQVLRLLARGKAATEIADQLGMPTANTVYQRRHACGKRWRTLTEEKQSV